MNSIFFTHLAAATVAAFATFVVMQLRIDSIEGQHIKALATLRSDHQLAVDAENLRTARAQEAITTKYQGALNDALHNQITLRRDADRARTELDSLRKQTDTAARRLAMPDVSAAAATEYAIAASQLLDQCGRSYQWMAAKADGHAADARAMSEAWPVLPAR